MINWTLRDTVKGHGIPNARQLHRAIEETLGIRLSPQALHTLMSETPSQLRLDTAHILCTFLQTPLEGFLQITPEPITPPHGPIIQPYVRVKPEKLVFTDPSMFFR